MNTRFSLCAFMPFRLQHIPLRVLRTGSFNIEAITFNRTQDTFGFGFRAPLVDDHTIVIKPRNPHSVFDFDADFDEHLQFLDLDRCGIRDIVFDVQLNGYIIVSQREGTKNENAFKLWFWSGYEKNSPSRIRVRGIKDLRRTEGVASVAMGQKKRLLLVSDEGDIKRQKNARFLLVKYEDLMVQ